jgi:serine phosphatase RsbU (regulator of sigma subunit)
MRWVFLGICGAALLGSGFWLRSAAHKRKALAELSSWSPDDSVRLLTRNDYLSDVHGALVYLAIALGAGLRFVAPDLALAAMIAVFVPALAITFFLARFIKRDARLVKVRLELERRAEEVLQQQDSAPRQWAERLVPSAIPSIEGLEVASHHQAGTGVMSGDLVDLFRLPGGRWCAVVGDVSGHGVEASITAMQTKYLLRSYLRRYRDPAQAVEELNAQGMDLERPEEFVSLFVAVFDPQRRTLRYASAGHPPAWTCRQRAPRALAATGPLLMVDPEAAYHSVEHVLEPGELVVIHSDGISEARSGDELFGEERIAAAVRRAADEPVLAVCKAVVESAMDFADGPLRDDVSVLAIRCG